MIRQTPAFKLCDVSEAIPGQLADYTTLRLGGAAERVINAESTADIVAAIREADSKSTSVLLIAGGSNLVISDQGFNGTALILRSSGITTYNDDDHVMVTAEAGHPWDDLVSTAVASGWSGIECLSGIPGSTGATPIQNVGAYGQEVAHTFDNATVYDRHTAEVTKFNSAQCHFQYRNSIFKRNDRYVVLDVTYRLRRDTNSSPIRYAETAKRLGIEVGQRVPLHIARETVLGLRRGKGMVLDPSDPDTYSVGSFFVNPVVPRSSFAALCERISDTPPHWPADGDVKISAAWLIGHAGFSPGHGSNGVAISSKHTLALTNRGTGTTTALLNLAAEVRDGVAEAFGITLHAEPVLVNADF